jgi:hypothetical protein
MILRLAASSLMETMAVVPLDQMPFAVKTMSTAVLMEQSVMWLEEHAHQRKIEDLILEQDQTMF